MTGSFATQIGAQFQVNRYSYRLGFGVDMMLFDALPQRASTAEVVPTASSASTCQVAAEGTPSATTSSESSAQGVKPDTPDTVDANSGGAHAIECSILAEIVEVIRLAIHASQRGDMGVLLPSLLSSSLSGYDAAVRYITDKLVPLLVKGPVDSSLSSTVSAVEVALRNKVVDVFISLTSRENATAKCDAREHVVSVIRSLGDHAAPEVDRLVRFWVRQDPDFATGWDMLKRQSITVPPTFPPNTLTHRRMQWPPSGDEPHVCVTTADVVLGTASGVVSDVVWGISKIQDSTGIVFDEMKFQHVGSDARTSVVTVATVRSTPGHYLLRSDRRRMGVFLCGSSEKCLPSVDSIDFNASGPAASHPLNLRWYVHAWSPGRAKFSFGVLAEPLRSSSKSSPKSPHLVIAEFTTDAVDDAYKMDWEVGRDCCMWFASSKRAVIPCPVSRLQVECNAAQRCLIVRSYLPMRNTVLGHAVPAPLETVIPLTCHSINGPASLRLFVRKRSAGSLALTFLGPIYNPTGTTQQATP